MNYVPENQIKAAANVMESKPVLDLKSLVLYIQRDLEKNGIDPEAPRKLSIEYLEKMSYEDIKKQYPHKKRP